MDYLNTTQSGRNRALSVRSITDAEHEAMVNSIAKLENDITMLDTEWNRIINKNSNPLELALRFLDETSVGLHRRFHEFEELKSCFAKDLQEVANDNYQAFNDSVASFSQTVDCITDAQDTLADIKVGVNNSLSKLSITDETLSELNEEYMKQSKMISTLTAMEEVIRINDRIEQLLMSSDYFHAQELLITGFALAKEHNLWELDVLKNVKDQFATHEHQLFELLIENITEIIYSKRVSTLLVDDQPLFSVDTNENTFGSLENYLHHVIHADIGEESYKKNQILSEFLNKLGQVCSEDDEFAVNEESDYDKIYSYLKILNAMNKLPLAIDVFVKRSTSEMRNIITKCVEDIRLKHPSLLKVGASIQSGPFVGLAGQDILSVLLRKLFWEIFVKFLLAVQAHRVIYEITKALQPPTTSSLLYPFVDIWNNCLAVVKELITDYTKDASLLKDNGRRRRNSSNLLRSNKNSKTQIFKLQNNLEKEDSNTIEQADELKTMLTDMFPGFTVSSNIDLQSIYLDEERFEEEETLVPPTVFNMRVMLESFLIFIQGLKSVIPPSLEEKTTSSTDFFLKLMQTEFLPQLNITMTYLYETQVESNIPFAFETLIDGTTVFKSAVDFKSLFIKLLQITNTSNFYRKPVAEMLVSILNKFASYYFNIYQSICGSENTIVSKKLISYWLNDKALTKVTGEIFGNDFEFIKSETKLLFSHCPRVFQDSNTLEKTDYFSDSTLDTLIHFCTTLECISTWLPALKKEVKDTNETNSAKNAELRSMWSFFEVTESDVPDKGNNARFLLNKEMMKNFDLVTEKFVSLHYTLLQCVRYDIRVRCLYQINCMFHSSKWNPEVTSIELDENITSLASELSFLENKLKSAFKDDHMTLVFIGISNFINYSLIKGARCVQVLNINGTKKLLRNVNALQQACKTVTNGKDMEDLSSAILFLNLCSMDENSIISAYKKGELKGLDLDDVKNSLRLLFSEELDRQAKRKSGSTQRVMSISANKRLVDALKKLDQQEDVEP